MTISRTPDASWQTLSLDQYRDSVSALMIDDQAGRVGADGHRFDQHTYNDDCCGEEVLTSYNAGLPPRDCMDFLVAMFRNADREIRATKKAERVFCGAR